MGVMREVITWWSGFKDWINWIWRESMRQIMGVFSTLWGAVVAVFALIALILDWGKAFLAYMINLVVQLDIPGVNTDVPPVIMNALNVANTFFPFQEAFELFVIYVAFLAVLGTLMIARWAKGLVW